MMSTELNRNFGNFLSVLGFFSVVAIPTSVSVSVSVVKKPRFSVAVSVTDPAIVCGKRRAAFYTSVFGIESFDYRRNHWTDCRVKCL